MHQLVLLLLIIDVSTQFEIKDDLGNSSFIIATDSQINLFDSYKFIAYSIPKIFVSQVEKWYSIHRKFCKGTYNISIFDSK